MSTWRISLLCLWVLMCGKSQYFSLSKHIYKNVKSNNLFKHILKLTHFLSSSRRKWKYYPLPTEKPQKSELEGHGSTGTEHEKMWESEKGIKSLVPMLMWPLANLVTFLRHLCFAVLVSKFWKSGHQNNWKIKTSSFIHTF